MKDTFFLVRGEEGWEERYEANKLILPNLQLVQGEDSIFKSMNKCKSISTTPTFVLVDGDNLLTRDAVRVLHEDRPSVWFTTNYLGISYGHGGVKILDKTPISTNGSISDITSRMGLLTIREVISVHAYDFSEFNRWKTEFKELLKLYLWGDTEILPLWLSHERIRQVMSRSVIPHVRKSSLNTLSSVVHDPEALRELYSSFSGEYTDTKL